MAPGAAPSTACSAVVTHPWVTNPERIRSAENMVEEIEVVHRKFGVHYFYLCDDIFFINKERSRKFCELLIKKKPGNLLFRSNSGGDG